jgi:hypothetical protein
MDRHHYQRWMVMSRRSANIAASSTLAHSRQRSKRLKKSNGLRDPSKCWCHHCSTTPHEYLGVSWDSSKEKYELQIPVGGGVLVGYTSPKWSTPLSYTTRR